MLCIVIMGLKSIVMERSQVKHAWRHVEDTPMELAALVAQIKRMHVTGLLAVCVKMVAAWGILVSAPVAVLLIAA